MSKKKILILLIVFVFLEVFFIYALPRILICYQYSKLFHTAEFVKSLSGKCNDVEIAYDGSVSELSFGYCQLTLPKDRLERISRKFDAVLLELQNDTSVIFLTPFYASNFSSDGNFTWHVNSSKVMPKSNAEIYFMSKTKFDLLFKYSLAKSLNSYNQKGIGVFRNKNIHGIIRYGPDLEPGELLCEVWANEGAVCQGIRVSSNSDEESLKILQCILSTLTYSVQEVPTSKEFQAFADNSISSHALFVEGD